MIVIQCSWIQKTPLEEKTYYSLLQIGEDYMAWTIFLIQEVTPLLPQRRGLDREYLAYLIGIFRLQEAPDN